MAISEERYQQLVLERIDEVKANQTNIHRKLESLESEFQTAKLDIAVFKNTTHGVPEALDRITIAINEMKIAHGKLNPDNVLQRINTIELENATRKGKELTFAGFTGIIGGIIVGLFQHYVLGNKK